MKKLLLLLSTLAFVNASFGADADNDKPYIEIGYTGLTYKEDSYSVTPSNIRFIVGKNDGNFGYEGMLGFNSSSGNLTLSGLTNTLKVNYIYGLYAKALTNLTSDIEVFGRLGWAGINQTTSYSDGSASLEQTGSGLSYGVGAKFKVSKNMNLNLDYMVYYPTKSGISLNGYTIGVGVNF
jgi:opacity protein-like surface antigen